MTSFGGKAIPIDEKIDMVIEIPRERNWKLSPVPE